MKPRGTIVLVENFQQPVERLNRARERFRSEPPEEDPRNLRLDLEETLRFWRERDWTRQRVQSYPLSSFLVHVVIRRLERGPRGRFIRSVLTPLIDVAARLDDAASGFRPHFGKDTMLTLRREARLGLPSARYPVRGGKGVGRG